MPRGDLMTAAVPSRLGVFLSSALVSAAMLVAAVDVGVIELRASPVPSGDADELADSFARFDKGDAAVAAVLAKRGVDAVPGLVERLRGSDAALRVRAADVLVAVGAPAVAPLADAAKSAALPARVLALETLGRVTADHDEAAAPLAAALTDAEAKIRAAAARGFLAAGPKAKDAVGALKPLLGDNFVEVRISAAAATIRCGGVVAPAYPVLVAGCTNADASIRALAVRFIAQVGLPSDKSVPPLVAATTDADENVRLAALTSLPAAAAADPQREQAINAFLVALGGGADACRAAAIRGLVALNARRPRVIDAFSRDANAHPADRALLVESIPKLTDMPVDEVLHVGGPYRGDRIQRRQLAKLGGSPATEAAVAAALDWFARHQSPDGGWHGETFESTCKGKPCGGAGWDFDEGLTGLSLLAFLAAGETQKTGPHQAAVAAGLAFLRGRQGKSGVVGGSDNQKTFYDHSIATMALSDDFLLTGDPAVGQSAQAALDFLTAARGGHLAWGYDIPKMPWEDTSASGWAVHAFAIGRAAGLRVSTTPEGRAVDVFKDALSWVDQVTEDEFGRTGYRQHGGPPARTADTMTTFPADQVETCTPIGVMIRLFAGQTPAKQSLIVKGVQLCARKPPEWSVGTGKLDFYAWYWGTLAMRQVGTSAQWAAWNKAMVAAILPHQHTDAGRCDRGSWDPVDAWSTEGGRIYATALNCLCLESYWRMDPLVESK